MILTSTEPNIFRMLFSIKNQKIYFKIPVPLVGQTTRPLHEILTRLVVTVFGQPKIQESYNIYFFFDGKQHPKNIGFCGC